MSATYEPIATTTISGTSTSSVTFSAIPQTYTDLILVATGSGTGGPSLYMRVGAGGSIDTASNYSNTRLYGFSGGAGSDNLTGDIWYISTGAFTDSNTILNLQNYSNTSTFKTYVSRQNSPSAWVNASIGLWRSTSAVNIINLFLSGGTFTAGSMFTIYGIKAE